MRRGIPGIESLKIGNGELRWEDGTECTLPVLEDGKLVIPIGGKLVTNTYEWFDNFASHRMFISKELIAGIENLSFVPARAFSKKIPMTIMPILRDPILIDGKYRLIARYSRYAISEQGELFDLKRRMPVYSLYEIAGYLCKNVWDGFSRSSNNVPLHRLLGMAWIDNDDYLEKYIINHKNGIKQDNELPNLEWASYAQNNMHAVRERLRESSLKGRLRSRKTGEIMTFTSFRQACALMGLHNNPPHRPSSNPALLWNNEFELRLEDDGRPWFYDEQRDLIDIGRYKTTVTYPDGKVETFYTGRSLLAHFGVKTTGGRTLTEYVRSLQKRKPYLVIEMVDLSSVNKELRYQKRLTRNHLISTRCIEASHEDNVQNLKFRSMYAVSDHFKVDRKTIRIHMNNQTLYKGWKFSKIES